MSSKKLTVTGTGDSLFTAKFPDEYTEKIRPVADFIQSCDLRITNLETNLSDFGDFANAYSGGTWLNTRPECFPDLKRYGFNYYGTANNHVMDYSYHGMLSTLDVLDQHGLAHSGTGRSLEEAQKGAVVQTENGVKCAIFAVDCPYDPVSTATMAGKGTRYLKSRPGVNYLRYDTYYPINQEEEQLLRGIADKININTQRQRSIDTGFLNPDPPGVFVMGKLTFTTDPEKPRTICNAKDKARLLEQIRLAKAENDYVFILVHCHDDDGVAITNPPAYLKEFVHACIDEGVSAVFGGGCHQLRPIEIYKGKPIFYSLGDFIYQGLTVEVLPADFMEKYGVDINSTAAEGLYARSRGNKVGLHCNKRNYQTLLPKLEFENGEMTSFSLLPVYLNFDRKDEMNGLPEIATGKEAQEILERMQELCMPYNLKFKLDNGAIVLTD